MECLLGALAGCLNVVGHTVADGMDLGIRNIDAAVPGCRPVLSRLPAPPLKVLGTIRLCVPDIECPECGRRIAMHELETRTVARRDEFETTYRCPYCGGDFPDPSGLF